MSKDVATLCHERMLTAEGLSMRSGLELNRVHAILLGRWTPSPSERQCIAAVFEVEITEIAWGHKTPIQHIYGHGPG
ncbi:MAG: hypothetical protein KDA42_04890 [Planctomycetales bacterium]|nr:hypothetical protein [Planctomycetales bacterium]